VRIVQGRLENLAGHLSSAATPPSESPLFRNLEGAGLAELVLITAAVADAPMAMILSNEGEGLRCQARIGPVEFELPAESRLYTCAAEASECLIVPDALIDARFCEDPLVAGGPRVRFYAAFPLRGRVGQILGLLCLFDCRPRELNPTQHEALRLISRKLGEWFEARCPSGAAVRGNTQKQQLMRAIKRAADSGDFRLHYQPKIDLRANRIVGLEALMRWHPTGGSPISPNVFVPLLEESGLILPVGAWVIAQALTDYRRWLSKGLGAPSIAVNVSPLQLAEPDFVMQFEKALGGSDARQAPIDIEITEGVLLEKTGATIRKLNGLRSLGVQVAIDDFGTGYSSLRYLAHLPIDSLKIDRSFVAAMTDDADDMAIVASVIALAHGLDLDVIAEGVETLEQRKLLHLLRCDQMQGHLFSPAVDADKIEELLIADSNAATHRQRVLVNDTDEAMPDRRRSSSRPRR
jgi:EAL domain-containing protein (putative c-di-GMP-specific phosphodiesterase class I)